MAEVDNKPKVAEAPELTPKEKKTWTYAGPKPAPIVSNLPIDVKDPRLGYIQEKFHADELPAEYIPYVMETNPATKTWWK